MRMASTLVLVSRASAVQALRAHMHALEVASLLTLLVQCLVLEAMDSKASQGVLLPCKKNGHHDWGIGKSLCRVIGLPLVLAGTGGAMQCVMRCSDAGMPEKLVKRV